MKIVTVEPLGKPGEARIRVVEVPIGNLGKVKGAYQIVSDEGVGEVLRMPKVMGDKNIEVRAKRLAERQDAILLSDTARLDELLAKAAPPAPGGKKKAPAKAPEPVEQVDDEEGDPFDDDEEEEAEEEESDEEDSEEDEEEEPDEGDLDLELIVLGYPGNVIDDELTYEDKLEIVRAKTPYQKPGKKKVKAKETAATPEIPKVPVAEKPVARNDGKTPEESLQEGASKVDRRKGKKVEPETPAPPPEPPRVEEPKVIRRPKKTEKLADAVEEVRTGELLEGEKIDFGKGGKKKAAEPPAPAPDVVEEQDKPSVTAGRIRGYRLFVTRPEWPKARGGDGEVPRWYEVGDTVQKTEVEDIAKRWAAANFTTRIEELPWHHKAPEAKHTIWTGEVYSPICCLVPGCNWVGDHVGPHVRTHGYENEQYRKAFKYVGPNVVGRAATSLDNAHAAVRRKNNLRVGMFLAEIIASETVHVWKLIQITGTAEAPVYHLRNLGAVGKPVVREVLPEALFQSFRPIGTWTKRLRKEILEAAAA